MLERTDAVGGRETQGLEPWDSSKMLSRSLDLTHPGMAPKYAHSRDVTRAYSAVTISPRHSSMIPYHDDRAGEPEYHILVEWQATARLARPIPV